MNYKLIAAVCKGGGIGKSNSLPWNIKEDLVHFSKLTKGSGRNAVIMGRKTWEGLPNGILKGRDNLILSNTLTIQKKHTDNHITMSFQNIETINKFCMHKKYDQVWIIGGSTIYKLFLDAGLVDICSITYIDSDFDCDVSFPPFTGSWKLDGTYPMETTKDYDVEIRKLIRN